MPKEKLIHNNNVEQYVHSDKKRLNNPEIGLVNPEKENESTKKVYQFDPHIDPELNFDVGKSEVDEELRNCLEMVDSLELLVSSLQKEIETNPSPALDEKLTELKTKNVKLKTHITKLKNLQEPYLNWAGKTERTSFEVPTVSLHVHERIDPKTIIDSIKKKEDVIQPSLFATEKKPLRQAVEFYKHENRWSNRMIAGDSLLVMNSLLEKEGMSSKVQTIYIDPPYGIKYGSNFQPFVDKRDVKDGKDEDLTAEPEMIKAFRDTWELGIHSYLSYLRDRLVLSRELLVDSGSIFVQISDENVHRVRLIMDEVFGAENFVSLIYYIKSSGFASESLDNVGDFIIWYGKNKKDIKYNNLYKNKELQDLSSYTYIYYQDGSQRKITLEERNNIALLPKDVKIFAPSNLTSDGYSEKGSQSFNYSGSEFRITGNRHWKTTQEGLKKLGKADRLYIAGNTLNYKRFFDDFPVISLNNNWNDIPMGLGFGEKYYVVQSHVLPIQRCILMTSDPGDLVFDPTCGSGTTAYVAEQWGRRWITCDTSRVAITLAKQRLMTASFDYYVLKDEEKEKGVNSLQFIVNSEDETKNSKLTTEKEVSSSQFPVDSEAPTKNSKLTTNNFPSISNGFVYKTVPHITLKSIANNPEIDIIHDKWETELQTLRDKINEFAKEPYKEWEIPREVDSFQFKVDSKEVSSSQFSVDSEETKNYKLKTQNLLDQFYTKKLQRQKEIDESISRHATQETLVDQPFVDNKKSRVTGPFTVEAVPSPVVRRIDSFGEEVDSFQLSVYSKAPTKNNKLTTENSPAKNYKLKTENSSKLTTENSIENSFPDNSIARSGATIKQSEWRNELARVGVRAKNGNKIEFSYLEVLTGTKFLHAKGETKDKNPKRVIVSFGPEFAPYDKALVELAIREAETLRPKAEILLFCAFQFEEEAARDIEETNWEGVTLLKVQMNTDLFTEDLKKKRAQNDSFWLIGQPDVKLNSYQFIVFSEEVKVEYETFQKLSGLDSLAEISKLSKEDLRIYILLSKGRDIWNYLTNQEGWDFHSCEYSRRTSKRNKEGILEIFKHSDRFFSRIGNFIPDLKEFGVFKWEDVRRIIDRLRGNKETSGRLEKLFEENRVTLETKNLKLETLAQVEVLGFDYYDPKNNEIKSGGKGEIAMWMLDTDYDGRSIFPKQVFFPLAGSKDGWTKLGKNLRAEIDEDMLEAFKTTGSLPFMPGRQIAVKIVDNRGIESIKVLVVSC